MSDAGDGPKPKIKINFLSFKVSKLTRISEYFLLVANLFPLIGVSMFGWQAGDIVILYWFESAIIGLFSIGKIYCINRFISFFYVPFFIIHFNLFMMGHGFFLQLMTEGQLQALSLNFEPSALNYLRVLYSVATAYYISIIPVFVSHLFSYVNNFLPNYQRLDFEKQKEILENMNKREPGQEKNEVNTEAAPLVNAIIQPYRRIFLMHVVIIAAFMPAMLLGSSWPLMLLLIFAKTYLDLAAHQVEHRGN